MRYQLPDDATVTSPEVSAAVERLTTSEQPRLRRLWAYYRNPMALSTGTAAEQNTSERPYRQAQEWGLPARITGYSTGDTSLAATRSGTVARKEVVIENDIGWRIDAMVDHLFGRPILIASEAPDPARRALLTDLLNALFEANGSLALLQQMALLGAVYGFVDVLVKLDTAAALALRKELTGDLWEHLKPSYASRAGGEASTPDQLGGPVEAQDATGRTDLTSDAAPRHNPGRALIERLARLVRFEIVHPSQALPLGSDLQQPSAYGQVWEQHTTVSSPPAERKRWWQREPARQHELISHHVQLITPTRWYRLLDGLVVQQGDNSLGRVPIVHIQNLAMPFEYAGRGDVEALIPLQDELNTRLSDRAYRITMQSFKMFLGKGIDNFLTAPVGPGRMWQTDNEHAEVKEFGGDEECPSEDTHIADIREALDKTSGVPPVAAGTIRDRVGQLSSAAALRVTLQALLAKTERKRATYGRGIAQMCELGLAWLATAGLLPTGDEERVIDINWPSALPENSLERLREAEIKARLGVPRETVLREIGY